MTVNAHPRECRDGPNPSNRGTRRELDAVAAFALGQTSASVGVLKWDYDPADGPVSLVTLSLDAVLPVATAPATNIGDLIARVGWGIGGEQFDCELDWLPGSQAVFAAEHLEVVAHMGDISANTRNVMCRAAVSRLVHPARRRPTRSFRVTIPASPGAIAVRVPHFAKDFVLNVHARTGALSTITVTAREGGDAGSPGRVVGAWGAANPLDFQFGFPDGLRLPGFSTVLVLSTSGASPLGVTVVFGLAL